MADIRVDENRLRSFTAEVFEQAGLPAEDAAIEAEVLVWANLRGLDSHGVQRVAGYVRSVEAGHYNPRPDIKSSGSKYHSQTSLPLMGIINCPGHGRHGRPYIALITPHGDHKRSSSSASVSSMASSLPLMGIINFRGRAGAPGRRRPHYPSWGL